MGVPQVSYPSIGPAGLRRIRVARDPYRRAGQYQDDPHDAVAGHPGERR